MASLEERIANLPPEKRAQFQQYLRERSQQPYNMPEIVPRGNLGPAPLSFSQERLWFLDKLYPGNTNYNEGSAYRLSGSLDQDALQAALQSVLERHEIIRTTYHSHDGLPVQVVEPSNEVALAVVDLSQIAEEARLDEAQKRFKNVIEQPFDLSRDLLQRCRLYRLHSEDHILLVVWHHIAVDGWSIRIFWRELFEFYAAEISGTSANLTPLPIQYADYAIWRREELQSEQFERHLSYWRHQLANLPVLDLPIDRRRPQILSYQGAGERFKLDAALVDRLILLARKEKTTLYMVLLAAYAILLSRYTSQVDFAIGTPTANRTRLEIEPLIGFFVNTLVMRLDLSGDPSFRDLLQRVREMALAAYDHQDIPFEKLVEVLQPERLLNRSPLVETTFQLFDLSYFRASSSGLTLENIDVPKMQTKFDIVCNFFRRSDGIYGHWIYATDIFRADTIWRMIGHYQTLLASITADPDSPIGKLTLLTEPERQQILADWNSLPTQQPSRRCIHELFEAQVEKAPDAVAVTHNNSSLTYRQLNEQANQLAHHLLSLGVGPEVKVGLFLDRSLDLVVALLAVLKAGGTYVPLDPAYPRERIAFMLDDAAIAVIISEKKLRDELPDSCLASICLGEANFDLDSQPAFAPDVEVAPQHAAYIIYTSGSTGQPKGVIVSHANVVRLFQATDHWFSFGSKDVWTLFHSYAFDFSVWELWGALLFGGRLVIVSYDVSRSPNDFYRLLGQEGVTVLNQTPTAFTQLIKAEAKLGVDPRLALRTIILGGEALQLEHLRPWYERHNEYKPQLVNMYGITETTVHVTYQPLNSEIVAADSGSPIGVPIPDLQVYVLDQNQHLVPIGIPGVLYVGGAGVTRGYLNRPELNEERFIDNPFLAGTRLYCSGDLVSWCADGTLQFLGRIDDQVKIRGHRIELGEIEAALREHPAVAGSAAIVREDEPGSRQLVAYWVSNTPAQPTVRDLIQHMRQKLPDYMVPTAFVQLDAVPLAPSGKIDRRALPSPDPTRLDQEEAYVAPRTVREEAIAAIWREIFGRQSIGVHDSFFELGGHSLLAVQIVSRIEQQLDLTLSLRTLFEKPTIAELAKCLG